MELNLGKVKTTLVKTGSVFKKPFDKYKGLEKSQQAKHKAIFYGIAFGVLLLILAGMAFVSTYYDGKAVPGTYLAGEDIGGQDYHSIKEKATELFNKVKLNITYDKTTVSATPKNMGLTIKTSETAQSAIDVAKDRNIFSRYNPFSKKEVPLVVDYDSEIFQQFLNEKFAEYIKLPKETAIAFNDETQKFEVLRGENGLAVDAKKLRPTIENILLSPREEHINVELSEMNPTISVASAEEACNEINKYLSLEIHITNAGRLLYYMDPVEIALWVETEYDSVTGKLNMKFNKEKIKQYLINTVAYALASAPVDEKILVAKDGTQLMVIQHGRKGQQINNPESVTDTIYNALIKGENVSAEVELIEADFKTENIVTEDDRWVEVNLSTQSMYLWDGSNQVASFIISSGVAPAYATPVGNFRIYMKTPVQPMYNLPLSTCYDSNGVFQLIIMGDKYCIPNVKWVSYFYQDYAAHTKYWNNIWGAQSSHGCLNMHEADAKTLYDFAPIGTRVIIHY